MHDFNLRKIGGKSIPYGEINIGSGDPELDFGPLSWDSEHYDERTEIIGDWFVTEKDRCVYTYDFGDNWEHDIVLEKKLPADPNMTYPYCAKAMRLAPPEDSRGELLMGELELEEISSKELTAWINEELADLEWSSPAETQRKADWSTLLSLVDEFKQLQPWKWMDDYHQFMVADPVTGEPCICSVMGSAGQEFGLAVYIGDEGIDFMKKIQDDLVNEDNYLEQRSMILSLSNRNELDEVDYRILTENGFSYRGKNDWPLFRSFIPNYVPWFLTEKEIQLFATIMEQTLYVCQLAKEAPHLFEQEDPDSFFSRIWDDDTQEWQSTLVQLISNDDTEAAVPLYMSELELHSFKKKYNKINRAIEFGVKLLPNPIQENETDRPYLPTVLVGIDRKTEMVLFHEILDLSNNNDTVKQHAVFALIEQIQGVPRELWVTEDTAHIFSNVAKELDIKLIAVKSLPRVNNLMKEMRASYR
ncbi:plasmid pRiA4b ORF-3 family protein [Bacillus sp. HMF5848]|nr:plasmid pRiA4b ORF-3 family protein [Bacillus sp. HMF5848]